LINLTVKEVDSGWADDSCMYRRHFNWFSSTAKRL